MKITKATGLDTIDSRVFRHAHNPVKNQHDFSGNNDIAAFIKATKEEGVWVVLRPNPQVCAEREFGDYP